MLPFPPAGSWWVKKKVKSSKWGTKGLCALRELTQFDRTQWLEHQMSEAPIIIRQMSLLVNNETVPKHPAQCNLNKQEAEVAVIRCKWPASPPPAFLLPPAAESNRSKYRTCTAAQSLLTLVTAARNINFVYLSLQFLHISPWDNDIQESGTACQETSWSK